MSDKSKVCELCGGHLVPVTDHSSRCSPCTKRLAVIDDNLKVILPAFRLEDGLRYARWAVLPLPPTAEFIWGYLEDHLECFEELPNESFEITVFGKRQIMLFFFDTLANSP